MTRNTDLPVCRRTTFIVEGSTGATIRCVFVRGHEGACSWVGPNLSEPDLELERELQELERTNPEVQRAAKKLESAFGAFIRRYRSAGEKDDREDWRLGLL